jgi:hypothetical protein
VVRLAAADRPPLPALTWRPSSTRRRRPTRGGAGDVIAGVQIVDRKSRGAAERALLQQCRRSYDGLGDTYVIRPVSLRLTPHLAALGATPNQVTVANAVVGARRARWSRGRPALPAAGRRRPRDLPAGRARLVRRRAGPHPPPVLAFGRGLDNVTDDLIDLGMTLALGWAVGAWWWPGDRRRGGARVVRGDDLPRGGAHRQGRATCMAFRWFFDRADAALAERFEHKLTPLAVVRSFGRRDVYVLVWAVGVSGRRPRARAGARR